MPQLIRLLVADGDSSIREVVRLGAQKEGWLCDEAADGIAALKMMRRTEYQLVILDTDLPELNGKIVCTHLRKTSRVPVIFLSTREAEHERLSGFAAGGNDYVLKPFFPRELVARIYSFLSLCGPFGNTGRDIVAGKIRIEPDSLCAYLDGKPLQLAPKEYELLLCLCRNPNQAFSRNALLDSVWGAEFFGSDRTVDTHIKSLRTKLRPYQNHIETIWGYGYKFVP